ncbi:MAG: tRNA guanosine(34) transglycosylase Tgt [Bdellovibrionota bacterium]
MSRLGFQLLHTDSKTRARRGEFVTPHGKVQTPVFMPVGTFASVKTLEVKDLHELGAEVILGNTYHLLLRPGQKVFERFGGIHGFMKWNKPVLTDSGGYQIFCLPTHRKITEEGAVFRSYVDGDLVLLSPEKSIEVQTSIGSDIMMVLDWFIHSTADFAETQAAMQMTHKWALRSLRARTREDQALFAIVQGGVFEDLRKQSAEFLTQHEFDGFAIGGLAVGETRSEREDMTEFTTQFLPSDKPRYLMGVGTPIDLIEAVRRGVDMFDCVIPTMYAQRNTVFTSMGKEDLSRSVYKFSDEMLDPLCDCPTCGSVSKGYLHHLAKCKEPTGWRLLAIHNLYYYRNLMRQMRSAIEQDRFLEFYQNAKATFGDSGSSHSLRAGPVAPCVAFNAELGVAAPAFANSIASSPVSSLSTDEA